MFYLRHKLHAPDQWAQVCAACKVLRVLQRPLRDSMVLNAPMPVMVDFFSPTCGPCQMLAPVIADLAGQFAGSVRVAKFDTSRYQTIPGRYQVRGVPTLIFFKNGQVVDQIVGAAPRQQIEQKIQSML